MDLVEFAWRHASEASARNHHDWPDHDHLKFDRAEGRRIWREEVNLILRRNGVALELGADGKARRLDPPAAQMVLQSELPSSGDADLDKKLLLAVEKYRSPDVHVRKEALEPLWDALERVKTVLDPRTGQKKQSARALVAIMTPSPTWQGELDAEFNRLTAIGNNFQIRHFEADKPAVVDEMIDHLFLRAYSIISEAVKAITLAG